MERKKSIPYPNPRILRQGIASFDKGIREEMSEQKNESAKHSKDQITVDNRNLDTQMRKSGKVRQFVLFNLKQALREQEIQLNNEECGEVIGGEHPYTTLTEDFENPFTGVWYAPIAYLPTDEQK